MNNKCYKDYNHTNRVQEQDQPLVDDDDWIADRMENPQKYNERHVPVKLDDLSVQYDPQDNTIAANYVSLLFLSPVLSAAAAGIYVSSSDGINNTSCWTGGVQTPCATLDLAIQGASARSTAVPRGGGGGGNESGISIYLLAGTYTATVLEQQLIIFVAYSDYNLLISSDTDYQTNDLFVSPCNVFNLDFTPFLGNYSLCIAPHMSPLGAISFWYVVGLYPLLLLLLLYVWITWYDKGYKCVVLVTRPFHCCMARFWSMTGIEPSFTHSIASIYILCFTQLAVTSFKILRFRFQYSDNEILFFFFYDAKKIYFGAIHVLASVFAILVLFIFILLPTLYVLFYPFK
uniref:Uncharacterized protein n=1 Tax=Amphimedon queenslandica TaxID=400682 RepID=A0A1X7U389_AMPQE